MDSQLYISLHHDQESIVALSEAISWLSSILVSPQEQVNYQLETAHISVNDDAAKPVRKQLKQIIQASDAFILLIGAKTYKSYWVNWEVETAKRLNKPSISLRIRDTYITPDTLYSADYKSVPHFVNLSWFHP